VGHYGAYYHYDACYKLDVFPQNFLGPHAAEDSERAIATNIIKQKKTKFIYKSEKPSGQFLGLIVMSH
jgi:hypothetical protein